MTFTDFFKAVWGEDKEPFPWQQELAELALRGEWPHSIGLPTAAGKTALIDIAVYALAVGAPNSARRIFFVVDRRIIVDDAAERAHVLGKKLAEADPQSRLGNLAENLRQLGKSQIPLATATLRGGIPKDDSWTDSPLQPIVVCSTVDQVGSSLLFRAYGASEYARPIRTALVAYDALIILDEAHTSQPFAETLQWIARYRGWAKQGFNLPFNVVELSATPRNGRGFQESAKDLHNPILKRRWETEKRAKLVLEQNGTEGEDKYQGLIEGLAREARTLRDERGARIIGVIANRVQTARKVFEILRNEDGSESILLTGRARPWDRDQLWQSWKSRIGIGRPTPDQTIFVVATQCIEVGADIDFDGLVTELASIDALEQRFGRLARDGSDGLRYAAIVADKQQVAKAYVDPVYGESLSSVWKWLNDHVQKEPRNNTVQGTRKAKAKRIIEEFVPMGVFAIRHALSSLANRESLTMPSRQAPILLPTHLDLLCQTSPEPSVSPAPAVFLHGPQSGPADVLVVWRQDIEPDRPELWKDVVAICPPNSAEAISLPVWAVRRWLAEESAVEITDLEGTGEQSDNSRNAIRPALEWKGPDESQLLNAPLDIRPGTTIVVPALYGGCDYWGWNPDEKGEVPDIGDAVKLQAGKPILRLHRKLAERWNYSALAEQIRKAESALEARNALIASSESERESWVKELIARLSQGVGKLVEDPHSNGDTWAAFIGKGVFAQESIQASYTVEVPLEKHLSGCAVFARNFAAILPESIQTTVVWAAELHDIGKADPRFQAWLRGGNPIKLEELLAKSGRSGQNRRAITRARELAQYPKGGRHELMSVALLAEKHDEFQGVDFELFLHLIGSHHGRCRPFAPASDDRNPVTVRYRSWISSSDHYLERAGSGTSQRFWRLTRRYGWYGLAFLETLVRLADHRQSELEQEAKIGAAAYA